MTSSRWFSSTGLVRYSSQPASEPRSLSNGELRLVSITTAVRLTACLLPLISLQTW